MRRPCCVQCGLSMHIKKTGVPVIEMAGEVPYRMWSADLWTCEKCGHEVLSGWGEKPIVTRGEPDFNKLVESCTRMGAIQIDKGKP